jgi:hypothetical protein
MFVKEDTRELARIVRIDQLLPIPKADRIEIAVVGGWEVVVEKGMYQIGDAVLYFEIDAAIPLNHPLWGDFDKQYLRTRTDEKTKEECAVIKTIRLRGALSQGLVVRMQNLVGTPAEGAAIGTNVTNMLGVLKYVSPAEAKLYAMTASTSDRDSKKLWWRIRAWLVKGIIADGLIGFPSGHVKSDEERVQNVKAFYDQMVEEHDDTEVTIKLDGESATFYTDLTTGEVGAAQRNYGVRVTDVPYTKAQSRRVYISDWMRFISRRLHGAECAKPVWKKGYIAQSVPLVAYFHRKEIGQRIQDFNEANPLWFTQGKVLAIQGEMVGPGFNRNAEQAGEVGFYMYRAYLNGNLLCTPEQSRLIAQELGLMYVPVLETSLALPADIKDILKLADGPGYFNKKKPREGIVVKSNRTGKSFKVISNKWLEKESKEEAAEAAVTSDAVTA